MSRRRTSMDGMRCVMSRKVSLQSNPLCSRPLAQRHVKHQHSEAALDIAIKHGNLDVVRLLAITFWGPSVSWTPGYALPTSISKDLSLIGTIGGSSILGALQDRLHGPQKHWIPKDQCCRRKKDGRVASSSILSPIRSGFP